MIGTVRALATRTARAQPQYEVAQALAVTGTGLAADIHADPLSPRQLLLASSEVYEDLRLPPRTLSENLLVDFDTAPLVSGTVLQIGEAVRLRLMFACEACGQLDRVQPSLARRIGPRRGMLARVLAGGELRSGDPVHDLGVLAPAWSEDWRERVRRVLDVVPAGSVVEYRQLARLAGIQSSYCRAFPRLIASLGMGYATRAVGAQSLSPLPRWHGEDLFQCL